MNTRELPFEMGCFFLHGHKSFACGITPKSKSASVGRFLRLRIVDFCCFALDKQ